MAASSRKTTFSFPSGNQVTTNHPAQTLQERYELIQMLVDDKSGFDFDENNPLSAVDKSLGDEVRRLMKLKCARDLFKELCKEDCEIACRYTLGFFNTRIKACTQKIDAKKQELGLNIAIVPEEKRVPLTKQPEPGPPIPHRILVEYKTDESFLNIKAKKVTHAKNVKATLAREQSVLHPKENKAPTPPGYLFAEEKVLCGRIYTKSPIMSGLFEQPEAALVLLIRGLFEKGEVPADFSITGVEYHNKTFSSDERLRELQIKLLKRHCGLELLDKLDLRNSEKADEFWQQRPREEIHALRYQIDSRVEELVYLKRNEPLKREPLKVNKLSMYSRSVERKESAKNLIESKTSQLSMR